MYIIKIHQLLQLSDRFGPQHSTKFTGKGKPDQFLNHRVYNTEQQFIRMNMIIVLRSDRMCLLMFLYFTSVQAGDLSREQFNKSSSARRKQLLVTCLSLLRTCCNQRDQVRITVHTACCCRTVPYEEYPCVFPNYHFSFHAKYF